MVMTDKSNGEVKTAPVEDLGFVVLEHPQITLSTALIQLMSEHNVGVVFCDNSHHPCSMMLNLDANQTETERFRFQALASEGLRKNLWMQTVKAKIRNQAALLGSAGKNEQALLRLADQVRSGDPHNLEAQASRRYWPSLFGSQFLRARAGPEPNPALNYGYAILRAATARALAGSGLLPALGIHHRNRYNSFCLADDMMEPYRPFVDLIVTQMRDSGMNLGSLGRREKSELLTVLTSDTVTGGKRRPLMLALTETSSSLVRCLMGEAKKLVFPEL